MLNETFKAAGKALIALDDLHKLARANEHATPEQLEAIREAITIANSIYQDLWTKCG